MSDQQIKIENSKSEPQLASESPENNPSKISVKKIDIQKLLEKLRTANWAMWGVVVAILSLIVTVVFGFLTVSNRLATVQTTVTDARDRIENVERLSLAKQFVISSPADGANVSVTDMIRGKTPFTEMNHYIIVTPLDTGDDWVQDNPVKVHASGTWTGRARFGASDAGANERFIVRSLATKSIVPSGPLTVLPEDAVFSEPVTVTRKE